MLRRLFNPHPTDRPRESHISLSLAPEGPEEEKAGRGVKNELRELFVRTQKSAAIFHIQQIYFRLDHFEHSASPPSHAHQKILGSEALFAAERHPRHTTPCDLPPPPPAPHRQKKGASQPSSKTTRFRSTFWLRCAILSRVILTHFLHRLTKNATEPNLALNRTSGKSTDPNLRRTDQKWPENPSNRILRPDPPLIDAH